MHFIFLSVLLLAPLFSSAVRENPLFDVYDTKISIAEENARLDNYAVQIKNSTGGRGLIVVYSESDHNAPAVKARARRAVKYLVKTRGVDPAKVVMRYDAACGYNHILLYLFFENQADPPPDTKCSRFGRR